MSKKPPLYLCPCCGSTTRQAPIQVSPLTEPNLPGQPVAVFVQAWQSVLHGEWQGMDPQFPWEGRVLVTDSRYAKKGEATGVARLLVEPRNVWRVGEMQKAMDL